MTGFLILTLAGCLAYIFIYAPSLFKFAGTAERSARKLAETRSADPRRSPQVARVKTFYMDTIEMEWNR